MDTLDTAEGVTRSLRAKGGSLDKIIVIANQLLDDDIHVHLPNKQIFIFDLLSDRLNDNNQFKNWKYDIQCWDLFIKVWMLLHNDKISRNKSMKKLKYVELLISVFKKSSETGDTELIGKVLKATSIITNDHYFEIDDNSSMNLLASYIISINHLRKEYHFNDSIINDWTTIIYKLYQIPQLNVNHKFNKKHLTKFVVDCLPCSLEFISTKSSEHGLSQSKDILQNIICKTIFNKESISSLNGNIDTVLKKSANDISFESITYLFELIINNLSSKDMKLCENLFLSIINNKKFNRMSEALLELLSNVNRSLSSEFFKSIYENEVKSNSMKNTNWSLVVHLFNLDIDLAMENSKDIIFNIPNTLDHDTAMKIGGSVADAYIRAREFVEFFENIWFGSIQENQIWRSSAFVDIISKKINNLSTSQLNTLLIFLFNKEDAFPLIISVLKGLILCPLPKVESVKRCFLENNKLFSEAVDNSWEASYYILCLYGNDALECQPGFVSIVSSTTSKDSVFYYYTVFRIIEITNNDDPFKQYQKHFCELLHNISSSRVKEVFKYLLKRWLIIINNFFTRNQSIEIINLAFKSLGFESFIFNYFKNNGDIFYEQKNLTDALLFHIIESLNGSNEKKSINLMKLVAVIPIQCFDRHSKKKLIDNIFEKFSDSNIGNVNLSSRIALKHLLSQPSFKSSIELDFKLLLDLIGTSMPSSCFLAHEILKTIWMHYLSQYNIETNREYVLGSMKLLNGYFRDFKNTKISMIPPEFQATQIIISIESNHTTADNKLQEEMQRLNFNFSNITRRILNSQSKDRKEFDYDIICWLLNALYLNLSNDKAQADTVSIIKTVGQNLPANGNGNQANKIRINLFKILSKLSSPSLKSSVYMISLFFALESQFALDNEDITLALQHYFDKLSNHTLEFTDLYNFVLQSIMNETDAKNISISIRILNSLIRSIKKEYQKEHTELIVKSLSTLLSRFDLISLSNHECILSILVTLKNNLSDKIWSFNQYALETTITLVTKISYSLYDFKFYNSHEVVDVYVQLTQVMSHIFLFHRYRLSSRHHVIINACVSLLEPLSFRTHNSEENYLASSKKAAVAYSRLLSNLCEPSNTMSKEVDQKSLNSSSTLIKRSLRKHLPVLILNYIHFALNMNFQSQVNNELLSGLFSVFNVLSPTELKLISSSLDIPGRTYYKTLYADYKENGKWKNE